ncbi:Cdkl4 [Symbiodinium sp. CCMP2592]|nr:Cdkl4 [Symbiodinium sp. CCMP2592]
MLCWQACTTGPRPQQWSADDCLSALTKDAEEGYTALGSVFWVHLDPNHPSLQSVSFLELLQESKKLFPHLSLVFQSGLACLLELLLIEEEEVDSYYWKVHHSCFLQLLPARFVGGLWPMDLSILLRVEEARTWSEQNKNNVLRRCPLVQGHVVVAAFYIGLARSVLDRNATAINDWLNLAGSVRLHVHSLITSADDPDGEVRRAILALQAQTRSDTVARLSCSYLTWLKMLETVLASPKYNGKKLEEVVDLLKETDKIHYVDGRVMNRTLLVCANNAIASFKDGQAVEAFLSLERGWGRTLFSLHSEKLRMLLFGCKPVCGGLTYVLETMYFMLHLKLITPGRFTTHAMNGQKKTSFLTLALAALQILQTLKAKLLDDPKGSECLAVLRMFERPSKLVTYVRVQEGEVAEEDGGDADETEAQEADEEDGQTGQKKKKGSDKEVILGGWFLDKETRALSLAEILLRLVCGRYEKDVVHLVKHSQLGFLAEGLHLPLPLVQALWSVVGIAHHNAEDASSKGVEPMVVGPGDVEAWLQQQLEVCLLPMKNLKTEVVRAILKTSVLNREGVGRVLYVWNGDSIQEKPTRPWMRTGAFGRAQKKVLTAVLKIFVDMVSKAKTHGFKDHAMALACDGGLRAQRQLFGANKIFGLSAKELIVYQRHRGPTAKKRVGQKKQSQHHVVQHVYMNINMENKKEKNLFLRSVVDRLSDVEGSVVNPLPLGYPAFPLVGPKTKCEVMGWTKKKRGPASPASWRSDAELPLFWREKKPVGWWLDVLTAMQPDAVVDFTPGCGLPLACLTRSVRYVGLAWNDAHKRCLASHIHLEAAKKHLAGRPLLWSDLDAYANADDEEPQTEEEDDDEDDGSGSDES